MSRAMSPERLNATYLSDPILKPFLSPSFDPADYLNSTLPSFSLTPTTKPQQATSRALPLSDLLTQTQAHISQLSAQITHLSDTLTSLTDDILRSGSRLAYEVEVLRGEALSLSETLTERLDPQVRAFVPGGLQAATSSTQQKATNGNVSPDPPNTTSKTSTGDLVDSSDPATSALNQLRTLTLVRQRLSTIIQTFDAAMSWPLPPSLLKSASIPSSIISVSAPPPPHSSAAFSEEEKGQAALQKLRDEINDLLQQADSNSDSEKPGIEAARSRIAELRDLASVWKGTAEERARTKIVDGLARIVDEEEAKRAQRRQQQQQQDPQSQTAKRNGIAQSQNIKASGENERSSSRVVGEGVSGAGFLRRLRDEIYLD